MLAVTVRAYPAAIVLLDTIHRVVNKAVIPNMVNEMQSQGTSSTEQESAIKNVMSAWRSSVAGTNNSTPNSSKAATLDTNTQPPVLLRNAPPNNIEISHPWTIPTIAPLQSSDCSKGKLFSFL